MDRKKFKRIVVTIALIGAFLTFGTGIKNSHADTYIDNAALYATIGSYYQGLAEYLAGYSLYYNDVSSMYDAYGWYDGSTVYAYNAAIYALNSSDRKSVV